MTIDTNAIRERANRANQIAPGKWHADQSIGVYAQLGTSFHDCPNVFTDPGLDLALLEHIAGLSPQVAIALADEIDRLRAENADLDAARKRLLDRLHNTTPDLVTAQHRADQAEDRATDLANRLHHAEQEIASHNKAVTAWANQVEELKRDLQLAIADHNKMKVKLDGPCGSCHPCTNYRDETWRAANRKPPHVIDWDDAQTELQLLRVLADAAGQVIAAEQIDGTTGIDMAAVRGAAQADLTEAYRAHQREMNSRYPDDAAEVA